MFKKITTYFFSKFIKLKWLLLVLILAGILFFWLGFIFEGKLADLFINISATFFSLIGVIFIIDALLENEHKKEMRESHLIVKTELLFLRNELFNYFREAFGVAFPSGKIDFGKISKYEDEIDKINRQLLVYIQNNLEQIIIQMKPSDWRRLQLNLVAMKIDLFEKFSLYKEMVPATVLAKLLLVKKSFDSFYSIFGVFPDLFINEEKNWPVNKFGQEKNRQLRKEFLSLFIKNLRDYFNSLNEFMDALNEWAD